MLSSLHIENVALIRNATLLFDGGFTVLTGETGAGKSIMIDALALLCGGRSDKELIRTGASFAFVEGVFDALSADTLEALAALEVYPDEDGCIFISRRITADGRSTAKIGDRPLPSSRLRAVAELLVDIHGQQDTLHLADTKKQLPLLDGFARVAPLLVEYRAAYNEYMGLCREAEEISAAAADSAFRKEMLEFKLAELKKAKLKKGEEAELEQLRLRLRSAEKIERATTEAYGVLYGGDGAVSEQLSAAAATLSACAAALPEAKELAERILSSKYEIDDVADALRALAADCEADSEARLDETETRLELIAGLKRRFGTDFEGLLSKEAELTEELMRIENSDELLVEIENKKKAAMARLVAAADILTERRREAAVSLEKRVAEELAALDMPSVAFTVEFTATEPTANGCDRVEFLISPNAGEAAKPLSKIASGGELARIMLAFKTVTAEAEPARLSVFDEIDTGVSGKTSQRVGIALKKLGKRSGAQVFCVTHSAQIAALADTHLCVAKSEKDGRTESAVTVLDTEARVAEIARIIGGINISEATLQAARSLLF